MTSERYARVREVFLAACERDGAEREELLARECAQDERLRGEVERLLAHLGRAGDFLEEPALPLSVPQVQARAAELPARIGPFALGQRIGAGGFGEVYEAVQLEPLRRRVALKLLKPGMDSEAVLARFAVEREALARMDHPAIAKVLDAGASSSGRPWIAMELVEGVPITDFCVRERLPLRERLELFVQVCQALQHAHHKGIVHRDVKPSNVLIARLDGRPSPKVIDFGVAKAIGEAAGGSLLTLTGQVIGTPAYMSPEQAAGDPRDVDTRSDVYSLGVLLYELLAGVPPFDPERLRTAGIVEVVRILREEEPPLPSRRVAGLAPADRGLLPRELRGDLDWIAMRALEKDRERRYATPSELAADLERHLADEPVSAGPPSAIYRFKKFARRNALGLAAAGAVLAALSIGLAGTLWQARAARDQRDRALESERAKDQALEEARGAERSAEEGRQRAETKANTVLAVLELLQRMLGAVRPAVAQGREPTVREVLDLTADGLGGDLDREPEVEAEIRGIVGNVYRSLDQRAKARAHLERALELRERANGPEAPETLYALNGLAALEGEDGNFEKAAKLFRRSLEISTRVLGPEHLRTQTARNNLAQTLRLLGRSAEAEPLLRESLEIRRRTAGAEDSFALAVLHNLATVLAEQGELEESADLLDEAWRARDRLWGAQHPDTLESREALASVALLRGDLAAACEAFEGVLETERAVFGPEHMRTLFTQLDLASACLAQGEVERALDLAREAADGLERAGGPDDPRVLDARARQGMALLEAGRTEEAEPLLERSAAALASGLGENHPLALRALAARGRCARERGRLEEAIELLRRAADGFAAPAGRAPIEAVEARAELGETLRRAGRAADAESELLAALQAAQSWPAQSIVPCKIELALARCAADLGRASEAASRAGAVRVKLEASLGPDHTRTREARALEAALGSAR
jgi:serine/threonine protein kinase